MLDDFSLIEKFIKGEGELLSNPNLRVESTFKTDQLLARNGTVVAVIADKNPVKAVSVNTASKHFYLMSQVLLTHTFAPVGEIKGSKLIQYEPHEIPAGYKVNYTPVKTLFKKWWTQHRASNEHEIKLDLLILTRSKWYPIRSISHNLGGLFFKTLVDEIYVNNEDGMVWLSRITDSQIEDNINSITAQSINADNQPLSEQVPQIDHNQIQGAEAILPIAIRIFNGCLKAGKTQEIKPGVWLAKGAGYNLIYKPDTQDFSIVANQRGVVCKYKGKVVEDANNLKSEDMELWRKIKDKLESQNLKIKE
ncbi:hypothetical protein Cri9333_2972 [Crinalium epipsammum PCC 9333]|uniref:Uncharacterized protein n=2 Tax=Crinalium TaxID=241421 RepID=K9W0S0_9CYAN|nr:hypothetical protein Cri9333_2972 [Crinalium epipsammum PCC 9333]